MAGVMCCMRIMAPVSNRRAGCHPALLALALASIVCGQAFEVASVRPSKPPAQSTMAVLPGGERFMARNMPLIWLISTAYGVPMRGIRGLPEELKDTGYDIEAKAERPVNRERMMIMLRSLLEDRFKLEVRRETREMKAVVLAVAKGGAKLEENQDGAELAIRKITGNKMSYHNVPLPVFANLLALAVDDLVVDRTGLKGSYDFTLDYYAGPGGRGVEEGREPAPDANGPSIHKALREQLGLELESQRVPVEMLVVEHVERPRGN